MKHFNVLTMVLILVVGVWVVVERRAVSVGRVNWSARGEALLRRLCP